MIKNTTAQYNITLLGYLPISSLVIECLKNSILFARFGSEVSNHRRLENGGEPIAAFRLGRSGT